MQNGCQDWREDGEHEDSSRTESAEDNPLASKSFIETFTYELAEMERQISRSRRRPGWLLEGNIGIGMLDEGAKYTK